MPKIVYPSVGVVILTYNSSAFISQCLESVLQNTYPNFFVTVVDNASTDNTITVVKKIKKITVLQNKKNIGYGAGNNIAIKELRKKKVDYILLLNPDTRVASTAIADLVQVFTTDNTVGIAGPMIMYMQEPTKIWYAGGYFNKIFCFTRHPYMNTLLKTYNSRVTRSKKLQARSSLKLASLERVLENETEAGPVLLTDFVTGACMMIKTSIFDQTGLLPEQYFLYYEDAFFCQKARSLGYTCSLLAKPLVYHQVSASSGVSGKNDLTAYKAYFFARNPTLYLRHEVHGILKVTGLFGQWIIQHPYFLWDMLKKYQWHAMTGYLRGIRDGLIM